MSQYVYAARCLLTNGQPTGLLKIGFSVDPTTRIHTLEGILPFEFDLVCFFRGGFFAEQATHLQLRHWRSKGEYFWDCPEVRAALADMKRHEGPHELIRDQEEPGGRWTDSIDLRKAIKRFGVGLDAIANRLHITPARLSVRLQNPKMTSRNIAAGVSLAAADKGIRSVWPDDFFKRAA